MAEDTSLVNLNLECLPLPAEYKGKAHNGRHKGQQNGASSLFFLYKIISRNSLYTLHWEKRRSENSALREPFWKMVPFLGKKEPKRLPLGKVPPTKEHRFQKGCLFNKKVETGALSEKRAPFLVQKMTQQKMTPFRCPWIKGTVFSAKKMVRSCKGVLYQCPWGTIFVWKR